MKKGSVLTIIALAIAALLLFSVPVLAGGKTEFIGTWCRNDDFSGTPLTILPSGRLFSQGGWIDWLVNTDDPRVSGEMHSDNTVFNLAGNFFPGDPLDGSAHSHFTLTPDGHEGTWEGVYSCIYKTMDDGTIYHTLILNGHGTGVFAGKVIKIHQTHEIPFAASMACWWNEQPEVALVDPWPFNGYIRE